LAIPVRTRSIGLDILETQITSGGTRPTLDVVVSPFSGMINLWPDDTLWGRPYVRVGMQLGYSFPERDDVHRFFRFGGHIGLGYEWDVAEGVALRLLDVRFVGEATGNEVDRLGRRFDLGVMFSSGVTFK
jgi:hypothetical protein